MDKHEPNKDTQDKTTESSLKMATALFESSHLANTDLEGKLTEFEFLLWRICYSLMKWHEDCQSYVSSDDVNAHEIAIIHLIRLHNRPKTIYEVARLLNRDDLPNLQYSLKKLLKLNIIKKSKKLAKKSIAYEISDKGKTITDKYCDIRRNILLPMLEKNKDLAWDPIYDVLREFRNMYDEASRIAAHTKTSQ